MTLFYFSFFKNCREIIEIIIEKVNVILNFSLDHHVRELRAKMDNQITLMKDINGKMAGFEQKMEESELRYIFWNVFLNISFRIKFLIP